MQQEMLVETLYLKTVSPALRRKMDFKVKNKEWAGYLASQTAWNSMRGAVLGVSV